MEDLLAEHRKEQKELQGRITQKKKNATKKTRKGVNDECERLERELKDRQQSEIDALQDTSPDLKNEEPRVDGSTESGSEAENAGNSTKRVTFSTAAKAELQSGSDEPHRTKKPNRQKARLARKAAEQEAQIAAAAEEAANQPDVREQEMKAMDQHKKNLELSETFIRPDGHCLFAACANGLPADVVKTSGPYDIGYQNIRFTTADFMSKHRDDFEAFMEEPFETYVTKIKDTAEWGGQLELQAIARSYNVTINVLQADGRVERFKPDTSESEQPELWLAYYKHSFGLGEHYNALSKS